MCSVFEDGEPRKEKKMFCQIGNFCLELGKNILFGIRNVAPFRPQNQVIESPGYYCWLMKEGHR